MDTGNILYARRGDLVALKFVGRIGFAQGGSRHLLASLNTFLNGLFEAGDVRYFLVDLTEASGIDSTGLGLLAKITKHTIQRFSRKAILLTMTEDMERILESMGFHAVFLIIHGPPEQCTDLTSLPEVEESDREWACTVLAAHKELCALNEANRETFRGVVDTLEDALERR